jgi:RNA polymerase sigma factor (sigma-70 family)
MTRARLNLFGSGSSAAALDPDARLALQAQSGSSAAFEALVKRHQAGVRAFLRRIGGDFAADDLAQETFLTVWRKLGQWRGEGSFKGWLYAIAVRAAHDGRRSEARARGRDMAWLQDVGSDGPADAGAGVDARIDLDRAMAGLPPDQRAVLALCYGAGLSHGEAAEALGLPLGTVKSHAARGRDRVLACFNEMNDTAPTGRTA